MSNKNELSTTVKSELAPLPQDILSKLVIGGDLKGLTEIQRVQYYTQFCERLGLDAATQPFKMMNIQGKLILYADRGCAAQLNKKHEISHKITGRDIVDGMYVVTAQAYDKGGRQTESTGVVPVDGLKGEARANAYMKAETKAKRRATLDLVGLGMIDEEEVMTIPAGERGDKVVEIRMDGPKVTERVPVPAQQPVAEAKPAEPKAADPTPPPNDGPKDAGHFATVSEWLKATGISEEFVIETCKNAKRAGDDAKLLRDLPAGTLMELASKRWQTRLMNLWNEKQKVGAK